MKSENRDWSIVRAKQMADLFTVITIMTFTWIIVLLSKLNADPVSLRTPNEQHFFFSGLALSSILNQELSNVSCVLIFSS